MCDIITIRYHKLYKLYYLQLICNRYRYSTEHLLDTNNDFFFFSSLLIYIYIYKKKQIANKETRGDLHIRKLLKFGNVFLEKKQCKYFPNQRRPIAL